MAQVVIDALRSRSHSHCNADSMAPPVAQQIYSSMSIIMGKDGSKDGGCGGCWKEHGEGLAVRQLIA